jgi:hypothetical protein
MLEAPLQKEKETMFSVCMKDSKSKLL